jgi:hypothetical protein
LVITGSPRAASVRATMIASADRDPAVAATDRQSGLRGGPDGERPGCWSRYERSGVVGGPGLGVVDPVK